jgi:hypothetical protein
MVFLGESTTWESRPVFDTWKINFLKEEEKEHD